MTRKAAIMFRGAELQAQIELRGDNANEIAKRDLARYYRLLEQELASISLTSAEWSSLRTAMQDARLGENPAPAELFAAIKSKTGLDQGTGSQINLAALVAKL